MKTWKQKAKRRLQQLEAAEQRASRLESELRRSQESEKAAHERAERELGERGLAEHQRDVAADALISLTGDLATLGREALLSLRDSYPLANPGGFLAAEEFVHEYAAGRPPRWARTPFGEALRDLEGEPPPRTFLTWEEYIKATERGEPLQAEEGPGMAEGTISSALEVVTVRMLRGFAHNAAQAIQHEPGDSIGMGIVAGLRGLLETAADKGTAETTPVPPEPYRQLVNAAQEVDALLSADGPPFRLDGFNIGVEGEAALLSLHDRLHDVTRIFFPGWEQHP